MRIELHETLWIACRIGAATVFGCRPRPLGLYARGSIGIFGSDSPQRTAMDASLSGTGAQRLGGQSCVGAIAQAHCLPGTSSAAMVFPFAHGVRVSQRVVDGPARGPTDQAEVSCFFPSALYKSVVGATAGHPAKAHASGAGAQRAGDSPLDPQGVAANKKSARRRRAHLVLIDESGFLMSPLVRRTLAHRGHTPILKTKASHRERVSATAALTLSPLRRRRGLYWQTYPRSFVNATRSAEFLRRLLRYLRGPVIVVWDGGPMHKGQAIRQLLHDYPRLSLQRLPPYAPELNPVEALWNHLKYGKLANFLPDDVIQLNAVVRNRLNHAKCSPDRIRSFWESSHLPFY